MIRDHSKIQLAALGIVVLLVLPGCPTAPATIDPDPPSPGPEVRPDPPPGPGDYEADDEREDVVTGTTERLEGRLSADEKQRIVHDAQLGLKRLSVMGQETLNLADDEQVTALTRSHFEAKLAELGFYVVQGRRGLAFDPSPEQMEAYRQGEDVNLVILIQGEASQQDRFGEFFSFESEVSGKVLNLTTEQVIASQQAHARGKRALRETQAAHSAVEAAAADLATKLTDELARLWEAATVVRTQLSIGGLRDLASVHDVRQELQARPGVYYVSLEGWDAESRHAEFEVLTRFDTEATLKAYVDNLRGGRLEVTAVREQQIIANEGFFRR